MASGAENFPVPRISRDEKVFPAMTSGWLGNDIPLNLLGLMGFVEKRAT
jgi:hypothetical protein